MSVGIREGIVSLAIFVFIEFVLYTFFLLIIGGIAGWEPLPLFIALAENITTDTTTITVTDIGITIFIVGTLINLLLMFYNTARVYF